MARLLLPVLARRYWAIRPRRSPAWLTSNPAQAVASLANKLAGYGMSIGKGEFIISGSLHAAFFVEGPCSYRALFDRLGSVTVRFVE